MHFLPADNICFFLINLFFFFVTTRFFKGVYKYINTEISDSLTYFHDVTKEKY